MYWWVICFPSAHTVIRNAVMNWPFFVLYFTVILQINNAGCMMTKREVNAEGFEKSFASNSLGEGCTKYMAGHKGHSLWCMIFQMWLKNETIQLQLQHSVFIKRIWYENLLFQEYSFHCNNIIWISTQHWNITKYPVLAVILIWMSFLVLLSCLLTLSVSLSHVHSHQEPNSHVGKEPWPQSGKCVWYPLEHKHMTQKKYLSFWLQWMSVSQITVTSGGMLVQKLRTGNLQSQIGRYDGTMVYAQNKVYKNNITVE